MVFLYLLPVAFGGVGAFGLLKRCVLGYNMYQKMYLKPTLRRNIPKDGAHNGQHMVSKYQHGNVISASR